MKFANGYRSLIFFGLALLAMTSGALYAQDAAPCPFADDSVIVYHSPTTFGASGAIQEVWNDSGVQDAAKTIFDKIDSALKEAREKETSERKKSAFDYVASIFTDATHDSSYARSVFDCYFRYVDGVVLGVEQVENIKSADDLAKSLSLTYIINTDPSGIKIDKILKKGDEYEIVKSTDSELVGKVFIKDGGDVKGEVFFGGAKVKDMNEFVIVFSASQGIVEKKLERFQNSAAFIANRLGDGKVCSEYIVKPAVFERALAELSKKSDDRAKVACEMLKKVKSYNLKVNAVDSSLVVSSRLEAIDAEAAKSFVDLAVGAVAGAKFKIGDSKDEGAKLALNVLNQTNFELAADEPVAVGTSTIESSVIYGALSIAWKEAKKQIEK